MRKEIFFIKDDNKIASKVNRCKSDIVWSTNSRRDELRLRVAAEGQMTRNLFEKAVSRRVILRETPAAENDW